MSSSRKTRQSTQTRCVATNYGCVCVCVLQWWGVDDNTELAPTCVQVLLLCLHFSC